MLWKMRIKAAADFCRMSGMFANPIACNDEIGKHGSIALGLGIFFPLLIGRGSVALMFFGSRSGHDDVAAPSRMAGAPAD